MKIVYVTIVEKIDEAITEAHNKGWTIKHIELTEPEMLEFKCLNGLSWGDMLSGNAKTKAYIHVYRGVLITRED